MDSFIEKILVDDYDAKVEKLSDKFRKLQESLIPAANQDKDYAR